MALSTATLPCRKAGCLLVHGDADETIPIADSVTLSNKTGIDLVVVERGNHGMGSVAGDGRFGVGVQKLDGLLNNLFCHCAALGICKERRSQVRVMKGCVKAPSLRL